MFPPGVCWRGEGGGGNRLPGLVTKQQAVEFPQVLASYYYFLLHLYSRNHIYHMQVVWVVVFTSTVLLGVDLGLGLGVGFSLMVIVLRIVL